MPSLSVPIAEAADLGITAIQEGRCVVHACEPIGYYGAENRLCEKACAYCASEGLTLNSASAMQVPKQSIPLNLSADIHEPKTRLSSSSPGDAADCTALSWKRPLWLFCGKRGALELVPTAILTVRKTSPVEHILSSPCARARSLTSESLGHRWSEVYDSESLKVWPFKKQILVLAEPLRLYGQPNPAGPASACLAVAGSDAALLGVQKDPLAVARDSTCARYAGLGLRCCSS